MVTSYSILNVNIREADLLSRVLDFILEMQSEIQHPDIQDIIKRITRAILEHMEVRRAAPKEEFLRMNKSSKVSAPSVQDLYSEEAGKFEFDESQTMEWTDISWAHLLALI